VQVPEPVQAVLLEEPQGMAGRAERGVEYLSIHSCWSLCSLEESFPFL